MKKEFFYGIFGLIIGGCMGFYSCSSLYYPNLTNYLEKRVKNVRTFNLKKVGSFHNISIKNKSKLSGKLELRIIDFDFENKEVFLEGDDGKMYKIEYDEFKLEGSITETSINTDNKSVAANKKL